MTELITPVADQRPPPRMHGNARYDWAAAADGDFHLWHDAPGDTVEQALRTYNRLRLNAREWAIRRGGSVATRTANNNRQVWIAIYLPDGDR